VPKDIAQLEAEANAARLPKLEIPSLMLGRRCRGAADFIVCSKWGQTTLSQARMFDSLRPTHASLRGLLYSSLIAVSLVLIAACQSGGSSANGGGAAGDDTARGGRNGGGGALVATAGMGADSGDGGRSGVAGAAGTPGGGGSSTGQGLLAAVGLRCEYLTDPLGIDTAKPRLSWALESSDRNQVQTAYQIVASDPRGAVLWDTGKVASAQQLHVPYTGAALTSGQRVSWTVRVWDRDGSPSGPSAPGLWEMGLLSKTDWKGKWVAGSTALVDPPAPAPFIRTTMSLSKAVASARVYVAAAGYYELYINGQKIGDHVLAPGYTRFDRRLLYDTHDVTASLQQGTNAIGLVLGNGFFNQTVATDWGYESAPWRATPRVLVQAQIAFTDGTSQTIASDESWHFATGPILYDQVRSGETYDARLEKPNWSAATYQEDASWKPVLTVPAPTGALSASMFPPAKVTQTLPAKSVKSPKTGTYVFDFGQNLAGWVRLSVSGPAGTALTLRYGERLAADGTVDQTIIKQGNKGRFETDTYIMKGQGTEVWEPRFEYNGFQYVEISGFPSAPSLDAVAARAVNTAFESVGQFSSSNALFGKIFEATRWSYRSNFQSIPTDCPHREKNGWMADAHLGAEQAMFTYDNAAGYTKWIRDISDEISANGALPGIVPTPGWGYTWGNGPAWDSAFFVVPYYLYLYYGDTQILTANYDKLKRYVDYLDSVDYFAANPGGWLGDWVYPGDATPEAVTHAGYHVFDAALLATVAGWLGKTDDVAKYTKVASDVKAKFLQKFYDPATGKVATGSQTALAAALFQNLVDGADRDKVLAALVAKVGAKGNHLDTGCLGTKYLPRALTDGGRADLFYAIATKTDYPSWGNWIGKGATTLWEDWQGDNSLNHIFLGDISTWFFRALAGINPDVSAPGFGKVIIRPEVVGDLTSAHGETKTMRGLIVSDWTLASDFTLKVTIPANTTATVYVPALNSNNVVADGATFVRSEGGRQIYEIGSGSYQFVAKGGPSAP
jgi:alpha-L-rhamnosidase